MRKLVTAGVAAAALMVGAAGQANATGCPGANKFPWEFTSVGEAQTALNAAGARSLKVKYIVQTQDLCFAAASTDCDDTFGPGSFGLYLQNGNRLPVGAPGNGCVSRLHKLDGSVYDKTVYLPGNLTLVRQ